MKAEDVMTTAVVTVNPGTSVQDVAKLMLEQRVSGVPVVDDGGRLIGLVSEGDLMRRAETHTDRRRSWWLRLLSMDDDEASDYVKTHGRRVRDVMSTPLITVEPGTDLSDVAMLLEKRRIKRVPVTKDGRLLGVVSRADLLRALAVAAPAMVSQSDDNAIRGDLVQHLAGQRWSSGAVNVIVTDGVVNLWGLYDSEQQHQAYLVAARNAPGARGVEDHMTTAPVT